MKALKVEHGAGGADGGDDDAGGRRPVAVPTSREKVAKKMKVPMAQNSTGTSDFFVKAGHDFAAGEGTGDNFKPDGTNRIIRATVQVAIVCNDKGNSGTLTTGDAYTSDITFAVQKVSNNISILGTVDEEKVKASAAMSSLVINVSADNATKEVKIKVTPPSGTGSTTKFRAVATLRCTEVAW